VITRSSSHPLLYMGMGCVICGRDVCNMYMASANNFVLVTPRSKRERERDGGSLARACEGRQHSCILRSKVWRSRGRYSGVGWLSHGVHINLSVLHPKRKIQRGEHLLYYTWNVATAYHYNVVILKKKKKSTSSSCILSIHIILSIIGPVSL
jgi:hypothetical protein